MSSFGKELVRETAWISELKSTRIVSIAVLSIYRCIRTYTEWTEELAQASANTQLSSRDEQNLLTAGKKVLEKCVFVEDWRRMVVLKEVHFQYLPYELVILADRGPL